MTPSRHQVVALAYDGLCTFEFGVAVEIFGLPRPEMGDNWYHFAVAAVDEGPLCATGGIRLMTDGGPELLAQADTIVVPGWRGSRRPGPRGAVRRPRCRPRPRMPDYFHLFRGVRSPPPGLLNGRQATTHWRYTAALQSRFPQIQVVEDVLYVGDALLMTSAGSAAGIDLVCIWCARISAAKPPTSSPAAWWSLPIATAVRRSRSCAR